MKKLTSMLGVVLSVCMVFSTATTADDVTFIITASIPSSAGMDIKVAPLVAGSEGSATSGITDLNFNTMNFDAEFGIYRPSQAYALYIGTLPGAGTLGNVVFSYADTSNPNASAAKNGLGSKGTIKLVKVVGADPAAQTESDLFYRTLSNVNGVTVTPTQLIGGFLKAYVGISDGSTVAGANPPGHEPFSNGDQPGDYIGQLTITGTVS